MLLAIDTSTGTSVALVDPERGVLAEHTVADTRRHAEVIGALIERVLAETGVGPREVSGVVAGMGPGPFTGLRVGIAAARAFAVGIDRPVLPLASHDAVAFASARAGQMRPILVVTDARRRELAWSSYGLPDADGLPVRLAGPSLILAAELGEAGPPDAGLEGDFDRIDASEIPAGALGLLAAARRARGDIADTVEPLYLRAPDVTLSTPKRVTG